MTIRKEHDRDEEHCAERATLSHAVSNKITEECLRKKAYQDARIKGDPIVLWAALQTARASNSLCGLSASPFHLED
jgi:hypothetical protein